MDKRPLVREQIDAGGTFLREFEKYAPVGVAFWYRSDDDTSPALSMASPEYRDENIRDVYGEIVRIAAAMRNPNFEGGDVKMVGTGHRLAKAALEIMQRYDGKIPAHYDSRTVGGITVGEICAPLSRSGDAVTIGSSISPMLESP